MTVASGRRRVGLIGHGAVGSVIAEGLERGVEQLSLAGVYAHSTVPDRYRIESFDELVERSDLVVEAASQEAVRAYGPTAVAAAKDLLIVSVGALSDPSLLTTLRAGMGRLLVTNGAIGGIDQLRAASLLSELDRVSLTTRKAPHALVRPWMSPDLLDRMDNGDEPTVVFDGPARDAVERFPASINVAATLALSTIGFDRVRVRLIADPSAVSVEHVIEATGPAGTYQFRFSNAASMTNPRTSAITPYAVLRGLSDLDAHTVIGF
jgi:aspartate dehydrogenase